MALPLKHKPSIGPSKDPLIEEFRGYLKIDRNALEEAVAQHPELFFKVAEAAAVAMSVRDEAEERIKEVDAELDRKLRNVKGDKDTEAAIKAQIQTHTDHRLAREDYAAKRKQAAMLVALERAFDQRGKMLRELTNLYGNGYFSVAGRVGMAEKRKQG